MRVGFAGTPAFAARALASIETEGFTIPLVLTQPDRPFGRGLSIAPPPVKRYAAEHELPLVQPASLKLDAVQAALRGVPIDVLVVAAYGLILPQPVLDWPRHGCLNIHASLLPRWRGAAPVERSILAGDERTGVTIHETVAALDAGPLAAQESFAVGDLDAGGVFERAAESAARLLAAVIERPSFTPQEEAGVTYAEKIGPADRELDLDDALDSWRRVRALSPHIGAWTTLSGRRVTIWRARLDEGTFVPELVQPEGRGRMSYDEFLRGVR
jgi:methionyl-tRNA formyltransferase